MNVVLLAALLILFGAVVGYFSWVDVLTEHFDTSGLILLVYNSCRILFLIYFLWILCGLGILILERLKKKQVNFGLDALDELLLSFYLGGAVITIAMFALGFLNVYYKATAILLALPILAGSFRPLCGRLAQVRWTRPASFQEFIATFVAAAFLFLAVHLLLSRCLYPGGAGNDMYEHYLPYQKAVLEGHGIWPNDVWPNFYNGKGMGLTFFAALLTDLLASQIVSYCFLIVSAGVLFSLARRVLQSAMWAGLSVVAYLGCFPYSNEFGWGNFQAHHIQTASWLVGTTWLASMPILETAPLHVRKAWLWICLLPVVATVIALPVFIAFIFSLLAGMTAWFWIRREKSIGLHYFLLGTGAIATLMAIFAVNHFASGWFSIDPLVTWRFANQKVFSEWNSPYLIDYFIKMHEGLVTIGWPNIFALDGTQWAKILRLDVLRGLFPSFEIVTVALLVVLIGMFFKTRTRILRSADFSMLVPSIAVVSGAVLLISEQYAPHSTFRNLAFIAFFMALAGTLLWKAVFDFLTPYVPRLAVISTGLFVCWVAWVSVADAAMRGRRAHGDLSTYLSFALGRISVHEAFAMGDGLLDYTLRAKQAAGIESKMLFLNNDGNVLGASYFVPGSGLLTEPSSSSFGGKWHVIALGPAELALQELKRLGINFILVNLEADFMGAIPFSPLFEPEKMTQRFDLVWSEGPVVLLTWRGEGKSPLEQSVADRMLARRSSAAREGRKNGHMFHLYEYIQRIYSNNQGRAPFYPAEKF